MGTITKFEDLEIWQLAKEICSDIRMIACRSDLQKDFRLYNQIDGSSGSAMDNIAEGFEREGNLEFIQFLSIAKGSIGETRSQLYRVTERNYCTQQDFESICAKCEKLSAKISAFISYLKKSNYRGNKYNR